ncbi:MAG: sodium:proton antiporter NhaD [Candidatus Symbiothrix sp.]|nr:sodium:proton antiporter NhaD [Candidatus Symbiothrix sp.]
MSTVMIIVFVTGYVCIALEHPIHINKTATALLLSTVLWVCMSQIIPDHDLLSKDLVENLGEVAEILFFLMGAMTIVEIVDIHGGFGLITNKIKETNKVKLLWIISFLTFFMSAILDNLTTSIVMIALLRKLIDDRHDRWFFAGMVILAANAGGAFSPIGDVTTIMLWIGGKISAWKIIKNTFLPSAVSILVPLAVLSFTLKGTVERPQIKAGNQSDDISQSQKLAITMLGIGALLFVPVFKTITHLPPYLGMLGGLGILWIYVGFLHKRRVDGDNHKYSITKIISRIDMSSILFFLGILMAVNALKVGGQLMALSNSLDTIPLEEPNKYYIITMIIGLFSAVIDNVPLVAGAIGMYDFPMDHYFWEFLAYSAGTGGSILIIGSAAGVAVMGMEKIDFIWYFKKISWLALLGYLAGCGVYILEHSLI